MEKNGIYMVNCPLCDAVIDVDEDELDEGDVLQCDECAATVRVTSTDPLEMESDEDEDEDDFKEEDDEEDEEDFDEENSDEESLDEEEDDPDKDEWS